MNFREVVRVRIGFIKLRTETYVRLLSHVVMHSTVNDELDEHFFFLISLLQFSTCFEQPCVHHQENQLYQYGVWYMSLCVGDHLLCGSKSSFPTSMVDGHLHRVTYNVVLIQLILVMMSKGVLETCRELK
jgi:hypothetical protein